MCRGREWTHGNCRRTQWIIRGIAGDGSADISALTRTRIFARCGRSPGKRWTFCNRASGGAGARRLGPGWIRGNVEGGSGPREPGGVTNQDVAQSSSTALSGAGLTICAWATSKFRWFRACGWKSARCFRTFRFCTCTLHNRTTNALLEVSHIETSCRPCASGGWNISGRFQCSVYERRECFLRRYSRRPRRRSRNCKTRPPGYSLTISGEQAKQEQGFKNLAVIMAISIAMIFLALAFQFKHSIQPLLVLAAAPYGVAGA